MNELEPLYSALEKSGDDLNRLWFKAKVSSGVIHEEATRCQAESSPEMITWQRMVEKRLTLCGLCTHNLSYMNRKDFVRGNALTLSRVSSLAQAADEFKAADAAGVITGHHAVNLMGALRRILQDAIGVHQIKIEEVLPVELRRFARGCLGRYQDFLNQVPTRRATELISGVIVAQSSQLSSFKLWAAVAEGVAAAKSDSVVWIAKGDSLDRAIESGFFDKDKKQKPLMLSTGNLMDLEILFLRKYLRRGLFCGPTIVADVLEFTKHRTGMVLDEPLNEAARETLTTLLHDAGEVNLSNLQELTKAAQRLESN